MDAFEKRFVKYIDSMLKTAEYFSFDEYSEILGLTVFLIKYRISQGIKYIARAIDFEYTALNGWTILSSLRQKFGSDCVTAELGDYIAEQDSALWENFPCNDSHPDPYELLDYITMRYRRDIIYYINTHAPFGELPKYVHNESRPFRIRKYDFRNRIIEEREANAIGSLRYDISNSNTVSRAVISEISPHFKKPHTVLVIKSDSASHICTERYADWAVTFYDSEDNIMERRVCVGFVEKEEIMLDMIGRNARYAVLSYRMPQDEARDADFTFQYLLMNNDEYKYRLFPIIRKILDE